MGTFLDLGTLEKKFSLNISFNGMNSNNQSDFALSSTSAPASLQGSPRGQNKGTPSSPAADVDRPRTLPPKSSDELQKHKKEYEEISKNIRKAMEKEAKDKKRRDESKAERDKKLSVHKKVWVDEIIPHWAKMKISKKAHEMWLFGLPTAVRGQIWKLAVGNDLRITKELMDISIAHARQTKASMFKEPTELDGADLIQMGELFGKEGTVALVDMVDLPKEFPCRPLFTKEGPMYSQLVDVLEAYVAYRPDVGFAPGMLYLAAVLLLNMDTFDAFAVLANLINKPFNLAFYITDRTEMYKYTKTADSIIEAFLPGVHKNLRANNIMPEHYLVDWFMTIFTKTLPLDISTRVFDVFLLEGDIYLFRVALAVLRVYEHQLETYNNRDLCMSILTNTTPDIDEDELFEFVDQFEIDPKKFQKLLQSG